MGVTGNRGNPYDLQYVEQELDHIEDYIEQDNKDAEMMINSASKPRKVKKSPFYRCLMDRSIRAKKRGARQARRVENTMYLLYQSGQDEPDIPEVEEFVDLMEHGLTPLATLFMQQEKMQIWNDFINHSESDQKDMLDHGKAEDMEVGEDRERNDSTSSWEIVPDTRAVHPAFSVKECFERIDHRLQCLLTRRHLPLGILLELEEELITFFTEWPHSVYLCQLSTGYDRMLLHALCQYLRLHSTSFDSECGLRQTEVENLYSQFTLPPMLLSGYIECRDGKHKTPAIV